MIDPAVGKLEMLDNKKCKPTGNEFCLENYTELEGG